jgi:saccharopine dehydrogenase-like NADP-dependent oxidoreductase
MIARGDVDSRGVVPPEAALEPAVFFEELARRRIEIHEIKEELE